MKWILRGKMAIGSNAKYAVGPDEVLLYAADLAEGRLDTYVS
jgi:hypothetical protein